jgi:hypothetical protein
MQKISRRLATMGGVIWIVMAALSLPALGQNNPAPFVNQPLVPDAVAPGSTGFTLTVNGTGFVSGAVVDWNGVTLATTFVSSSQLTATVPASDVVTAGTAQVAVVNPGPGGGSSSVNPFGIRETSAQVLFAPGKTSVAGNGPDGTAAADFNGDGKLDLAVANNFTEASTVAVLEGNGNGTFQTPVLYKAENDPFAVITADFNGDGKLDLAAANICGDASCFGMPVPGLVSVFLGNGDGTFQRETTYTTGNSSIGLASADFNGDGRLDLAVANQNCITGPPCGQGTVSVLLGNGDGTFQPAANYDTDLAPESVAIGDFNGDGNLDLASANAAGNTISVLLGNGDGTFRAAVSYATGIGPASIVAGDFNGDGKLDLATANDGDNSVSILIGNGDGTFERQMPYATARAPVSVSLGDYNGDSILDLTTANTEGTVSLLVGNGDGTFQNHADFTAGESPVWVTTGDFNGDGRPDLAVSNLNNNTVSVLLQAVPGITPSPAGLTFATQTIFTQSAPQVITLTSSGTGALHITGVAISGQFTQTNTCGGWLDPGASCTVSVTFKPVNKGTLTGSVTITDNAPGSPQTVSLTGTGTFVELSPTTENFGSQPIHTRSLPKKIALTNKGSSAVSITSIVIAGSDPGDFTQTNTCGSSVASGASCFITVAFTPTALGQRTANVSIGDNGGGSPQQVSLIGLGTL